MRVALIAVVVTGLVAATAGAVNQAVTLQLRQYTNANKVRVIVWYGQVSGAAARPSGCRRETAGRSRSTRSRRQSQARRHL